MVDFESIKHLEDRWHGLKMSGSLSLSHTEKQQIDNVYKAIYNKLTKDRGFCYHCPDAVIGAFTKTFQQYDLWKQEQQTERIKRKRING
jgi:hypothetical protein